MSFVWNTASDARSTFAKKFKKKINSKRKKGQEKKVKGRFSLDGPGVGNVDCIVCHLFLPINQNLPLFPQLLHSPDYSTFSCVTSFSLVYALITLVSVTI